MNSRIASFSEELKKKIEEAPVIVIYRHILPDADALGSQMGLKQWIESVWPDKKVLAAGSQAGMDQISDDDLKKALAVILDTSTAARIDGDGWKKAADTVRIDHHVKTEEYADLELVEEEATATCEILALVLKELGASLPKEAAQLIYQGLIADNLRFSVDKTSSDSFLAAAYLAGQGVDFTEASKNVFASTYHDFSYENRVRSKACRRDSCLFSVMNADDYLSCGHSFSSAKDKVYVLGDITDIEVWALFTMMEDGIHYCASLRSRTIPIRDIAAEYGGGGHDCASGIKNLNIVQVAEIIEKLKVRSMQPDFVITELV